MIFGFLEGWGAADRPVDQGGKTVTRTKETGRAGARSRPVSGEQSKLGGKTPKTQAMDV